MSPRGCAAAWLSVPCPSCVSMPTNCLSQTSKCSSCRTEHLAPTSLQPVSSARDAPSTPSLSLFSARPSSTQSVEVAHTSTLHRASRLFACTQSRFTAAPTCTAPRSWCSRRCPSSSSAGHLSCALDDDGSELRTPSARALVSYEHVGGGEKQEG